MILDDIFQSQIQRSYKKLDIVSEAMVMFFLGAPGLTKSSTEFVPQKGEDPEHGEDEGEGEDSNDDGDHGVTRLVAPVQDRVYVVETCRYNSPL